MDYLVDITIRTGAAAGHDDIGDALLAALERDGIAAGGVYHGESAKGLLTVHLLVRAKHPGDAVTSGLASVMQAWREVIGEPQQAVFAAAAVEEVAEREEAAALA